MGNTTGNGDSEKYMVVVLAIIVSSENSSPSCDFFDRCYCMEAIKEGGRGFVFSYHGAVDSSELDELIHRGRRRESQMRNSQHF